MSRERFKRAVCAILGSAAPTYSQLRDLGGEAAAAVGRPRPWTPRHLYNLLHYERDTIAPALFDYVTRRAGIHPLNGSHAVAVATRASVRPGALVLARSRRCARRRCPIHFVPAAPRQIYCSTECQARVAAWRRKRGRRGR